MNEKVHFAAAGFCGCLSLMAIIAQFSGTSFPMGAFLSFIPMCFVFVGFNTQRMSQEIRDLREQVAQLQPGADSKT